MASVILHDSFLEAAYQLPKETARKVWKALRLFARDPNHPSLNVERLHGSASGLLSLRVDDKYRIILRDGVPAPDLLFVSTHDEAYRFADRVPSPEITVLHAYRDLHPAVERRSLESLPALPDELIRASAVSLPRAWQSGQSPAVPVETAVTLIRTKKYVPLARFLLSASPATQFIASTFEQIEQLIGEPLPQSAALHRLWWGNDSFGHVQSAAWLASGWRVDSVDLNARNVRFVRI